RRARFLQRELPSSPPDRDVSLRGLISTPTGCRSFPSPGGQTAVMGFLASQRLASIPIYRSGAGCVSHGDCSTRLEKWNAPVLLEDLQTFVEVADAGGVSPAARRLGISKSIVSRRLS